MCTDDNEEFENITNDKDNIHTNEGMINMAVLAKPCSAAFELDESKAKEFFEVSKLKNASLVIERFKAHKPKSGVIAPFKK